MRSCTAARLPDGKWWLAFSEGDCEPPFHVLVVEPEGDPAGEALAVLTGKADPPPVYGKRVKGHGLPIGFNGPWKVFYRPITPWNYVHHGVRHVAFNAHDHSGCVWLHLGSGTMVCGLCYGPPLGDWHGLWLTREEVESLGGTTVSPRR